MSFGGRNIWIIGASSGIGKEIAIKLDSMNSNLIISARNKERLEEINKALNKKHKVLPIDVADYDQVTKSVKSILKTHKTIDRVIYLPAIYKPDSIENMDVGFMSQLVDVNLKSAFYVVHEILPIFKEQKSGQIALCGSVAGYTGLANGQPYSATKAAIINFAESLYLESPEYVDVKLISPGFVETPMTDKNKFEMPMIIKPEEAALNIINGLNKKCFEIDFPKKFTLLLKIVSIMPYILKFKITNRFR